jgi:hypothetical protein
LLSLAERVGVGRPMGLAEWLVTDTALYYRLVAAVNLAADGRSQAKEVAAWHEQERQKSRTRMGRA